MEEIKKILEEILNIDLIGATLSNPRKKEEIVKYLKEAGQAWVEDASNQDDAFARNQIRNQVIPRLEMINEQAVEHIGWLCEDIKEVTTYLTDQIDQSARTFIRSSDACHRKKNLPRYMLLPFANSQTLPPLSVISCFLLL